MSDAINDILKAVAAGKLNVDEAHARLDALSHEPLGFATLDHHRHRRCGVPEVIFAAGKTPQQVVSIAQSLTTKSGYALITRADEPTAAALEAAFHQIVIGSRRRTILVGLPPELKGIAVPIITAGTSDEAVAEEAALTCRAMGRPVHRINDVGVAGIGRLVARLDEIRDAPVVICIAGMEGALPSVVGGFVSVPVIAVPTSVGYGAALGGVTALMGMLTSCAAGVSVVNIDNGFGAGYIATLIARQSKPPEDAAS
ncbi:MAG: nickel pincer cofactor biosynthesis protein LarB [Planctomycetes bacterium]|nr:nickel pincer cofactor biosynthesis protein LarB [Planctomycetota bacterium]